MISSILTSSLFLVYFSKKEKGIEIVAKLFAVLSVIEWAFLFYFIYKYFQNRFLDVLSIFLHQDKIKFRMVLSSVILVGFYSIIVNLYSLTLHKNSKEEKIKKFKILFSISIVFNFIIIFNFFYLDPTDQKLLSLYRHSRKSNNWENLGGLGTLVQFRSTISKKNFPRSSGEFF